MKKSNKKRPLRRLYKIAIAGFCLLLAVHILIVVIAILTDMAWIAYIWIPAFIANVIALVRYYLKHAVFECPACGTRFSPKFWEGFWASHTPTTRKLTCPGCGIKSYCKEQFREE